MEDNLQTNPAIQPEVGQTNPEIQPSQTQEAHSEHKPTPQESFQELRMRLEQTERERNEAVGFVRQLEQYAMQQQQQQAYQQPQQPEPAATSYDDDDIIEGRHLKAEFTTLKRELQEQKRHAEEARRIAEMNMIESKLRNKYSDFDSVMTYDNVNKLRELKPEIAASLHQTQDLYNKAAATYTILKEMGIARSSAPYQQDQQRAQHNLEKPKPASSLAATSTLTHASAFSDRLTEERKQQIWQQMQENARRR